MYSADGPVSPGEPVAVDADEMDRLRARFGSKLRLADGYTTLKQEYPATAQPTINQPPASETDTDTDTDASTADEQYGDGPSELTYEPIDPDNPPPPSPAPRRSGAKSSTKRGSK